jgi:hypothetical protein
MSFGVWNGSLSALNDWFVSFNSIDPKIKATFASSFSSVVFLDDLEIFKLDNSLAVRTYQKSLNLYQYLPCLSNHPEHTLTGWIKAELLRYVRTNTRLEERISSWSKIYSGPVFAIEDTYLPLRRSFFQG